MPENPYPFGLRESEINALRDLTKHKGFVTLQKLLRDVAALRARVLLKREEGAPFHHDRGFINCLNYTVDLVDTIIARANAIDHERTRIEAGRDNGTARNRAFFGGPWWSLRDRNLESD